MRIGPRRVNSANHTPKEPGNLTQAALAFEQDWARRNQELESNPIMAFLEKHEIAGTPNEQTITGVADVKVTLGDLRSLVRAWK